MTTINANTLELEGDNEFIDLHLDKIEKIENVKAVVEENRKKDSGIFTNYLLLDKSITMA